MGGNALKHLNLERKDKREYFITSIKVLTEAVNFSHKIQIIPAYRNKPDFGDADILFIPAVPVSDIKDVIQLAFKPRSIYVNDSCYSFDYDNFQIDLIATTNELFLPSLNYYSYNDLGNLIGRAAHKLGLKYGHDGLTLPVRKADSHIGENVVVSRNTTKILEFLGYDHDKFYRGFDELEDIFEYATSTKYFNAEIFSLENLNHINRTRNRKRKVYMQFVEWLKGKTFDKQYVFDKNKSVYLPMIHEYFPESDIVNNMIRIEEKIKESSALKEKYNGNIVRELTGLEGAELGKFMAGFEAQRLGKDEFRQYMLGLTKEQIEKEIMKFHELRTTAG